MAVIATGQITLSSVIDVKATYRYYLLQSSTLAKPNKPTVYPPESSWDDVEPSYTDGNTNSLYFVDCTVFCDDTYIYSEVSLSSSYEAAKAAYNKATNAQNTANNAQADIDNLQIGARNLIRSSANLMFADYYFTGDLLVTYDGDGNVTIVRGGSCIEYTDGNVILCSTATVSDDNNSNITLS